MSTRPHTPPAGDNLVIRGFSKSFNGIRVLDGVDLTLGYGEVHGLLGQNGSGKSTLIKCLNGAYQPDTGDLLVGGRELPLPLPAGEFQNLGLSFVHQDLGLIPELSVLENLKLVDLSRSRTWRIDWRSERRRTAAVLEQYGLGDLDPDRPVSALSPTERALLAIVRAVEAVRASANHGVLVLDEPTVFLPREGVERLFGLVRDVSAHGTSVLFVSHDIDEVREVTDRVTVLRDGRTAGTAVTEDCTETTLVEMIVGRSLERAAERSAVARVSTEVVLTAQSLITPGLRGIDFALRGGEILGVTGLAGSGFDDVPYALFGAMAGTEGSLSTTDDRPALDLSAVTPIALLERGIALVPGDRQHDGAAMDLSVGDNITMQVLDDYRPWLLRRGEMDARSAELVREYDVRPADSRAVYGSLSGGNQQKALLAKWMQTDPRVLLLHEPTQGVDVGAREQIFAVLREAADSGMAVVCASSDAEQLARICGRVLILSRGVIGAELVGADLSKDRILETIYNSAPVAAVAS
ncbi:sugar ABC transporter ATP-binding protein [Rathayibacter sp. ZW T2_19]|uniref:Sugar ABC transporter ATP-binding protein n=1 Tax=Rathayibacter rubneri TaxID=2950106 RepID=A0A9X2IR93_9MICO|nr:sugar ABC transporter ATP-binding protein [Rathayibacter rubneri]MCM6761216.1 sugar ABC transporter ATP-binding protein [Rathayibacter rubneri]